MRHGVALNYHYVDLPSDIGTSGPENRLRFSGRNVVFFRPLGIISPALGGAVLGRISVIETGESL